jgi:hypothetical protein
MNKEDFAKLLNGNQYRSEMTREEEQLAKENDLLICFGSSDDLLELRGIIYDEEGACNGGTASIVLKKDNKLDLMNGCDLESIQDLFEENDLAFNIPIVEIEAVWCPDDIETSWLIKSKIPHASFDIMEDQILYCRGLVIEKADLMRELMK